MQITLIFPQSVAAKAVLVQRKLNPLVVIALFVPDKAHELVETVQDGAVENAPAEKFTV